MVAISTHLELAFAWITAVNQMNLTQLASMIPDDFVSIVRPNSLGFPPVNKTVYLSRLSSAPIQTFNISLPASTDIVETKDVVQFYTTSNGHTTHGFPWINEYVFTFTFTDNNLIKSVAEFADPTVITTAFNDEAIVAQAKFTC